MKKLGLFFGIALSILALYIALSVYMNYRRELAQDRVRLSENSSVITTSLGPIEYAIAGQGEPVIVIHGAGGGYDQGLLLSEAWVGKDFQRIAVSRFGYLRSVMPSQPSYALQADIIAELMDSLSIERAAIMGVSAGGPSTIQFALRHPRRCRGIILVSAIIHEHPMISWYLNLTLDMLFNSDFLYWMLVSYFPSSFNTPFGIPADVQAALTPAQRDSISYFLHSVLPVSMRRNGVAADRKVDDLTFPPEELQSSVLVIHAEDDNIVPYANAEYAIEKFPRVQSLTLKTGGHLLIGQYHRVRQTVNWFLVKHIATSDEQ